MKRTFTARTRNEIRPEGRCKANGIVLFEMLLVVALVGLMASVTFLSFTGIFTRTTFEKRANELVRAFELAYSGAKKSDRRYAVVLDFDEQMYILRQYASLDFDVIPEEEAIIKTGYFDEDEFYLERVVFDDGTDSQNLEATRDVNQLRFYAGRAGWQNGGKVVILDEEGNPYTIIIERFSSNVKLEKGDVEFLLPQYPEDLPF